MSTSKIIVITGASSGIGAVLARELGSRGHRLALAARREDELKKAAEQSGPGALAVVTDVKRREDVENLRDRTIEAFGHVDVWINNAGRGIGKRVMDLTDEDFDEMFTVNTKSALYGMQAIVPHFMERGTGHLINISSFLGRVPAASVRSAYSAAKAALNSLTANLRMDLRQEYPGIQISLVMPGIVLTEFAKNALGGTPGTPPPPGAMKPQTVEEAVAAIVGVVDQPVPEMFTNPALAEIARRYYEDVGAFEANFGAPPAGPRS